MKLLIVNYLNKKFPKLNKYIPFLFVLVFAILLRCVLIIFFKSSRQLFGDSLMQNLVIEYSAKYFKLPTYFPYLLEHFGFPRFGHFVITYPPIFYLFAMPFYLIFKNYALIIISNISIVLISVSTFLIIKALTKDNLAALTSSILINFSTFFITFDYDQDIPSFAMVIVSILFYLFFINKNRIKDIFVCLTFAALSYGFKQTAIFPITGLLIHFVVYSLIRKRGKILLISLVWFFSLFIPIIYYQIYTTGTISNVTLRGTPIIDKYIFHPDFLNISEIDKEIDNKINLIKVANQGATYYINKNFTIEKDIVSKIKYFLTTISLFPNLTIPTAAVVPSIIADLYLIICLMGLLIFLKNSSKKISLLFILVIISSIPSFIMFKKITYALILPWTTIIFFSFSIKFIRDLKINGLLLLLISLLIISSSFVFFYNYKINSDYIEKRRVEYQRIANIVNNMYPNPIRVWVNETNIWPAFLKKEVFWDYRLLFLNKEDLIHYLQIQYKPDLIIINKYSIVNNWDSWVRIPKESTLMKLINEGQYFKNVYNDSSWSIYKIEL
jgi:hypothetical protein